MGSVLSTKIYCFTNSKGSGKKVKCEAEGITSQEVQRPSCSHHFCRKQMGSVFETIKI